MAAKVAKTAKHTRTTKAKTTAADFPVVAIGASAGGLEALEAFFAPMPPDPGVAFVVVQHLDPTHKAMLSELLQRTTALPVHEARHDEPVQPNAVYVIPPNKDLTIASGRLVLTEPAALRGQRLPIDVFLRSLAAERGPRSAGVILSGMGSDGTLGLRSVKDAGGLVLVQDPASAKFDAMPRSALNDSPADIVASPRVLAERLLALLRRGEPWSEAEPVVADGSRVALERAIQLLREHSGHDFRLYKKSTALRRIERRMAIHQIDKLGNYVRYLRENPQELDLLFKELLIGVTSFFRDPPAWQALEALGLPALFAAQPEGKALRAWVVACSTGEEAYSLAIAFRETVERVRPAGRFTLQIFATDLHEDAIARARAGLYPRNIAADVPHDRLARWFVEEDGGFRVAKAIRDMVTFAPQNVILDPPFTKLDVLSCRNLMIYFEPELQKKLVPLFHYALNPGGLLFLGSAETIGGYTGLFQPCDVKVRLYRRLEGAPRAAALVDFPTRLFAGRGGSHEEHRAGGANAPNLQSQADQLLLQRFAPAAVLVSYQGDIVYISGRIGRYLEPAAGRANWNVHVMARPGLRLELAGALHKAMRAKADVVLDQVRIDGDDAPLLARVVVHFIHAPEALRGMLMVTFEELRGPAPARGRAGTRDKRILELEQALQQAREENQTNREEMQTSQEELKSSNEELQSTNEELQSTNEELTTSKEEMQSMNEELQMVNHELQAKVDELSWASNDMENLLNSTGIATVFLNGALHVRRFTAHATRLFKLLPGDTGRPLSDIATELVYPDVLQDAQRVLDTLLYCEREVGARDGRRFAVRIMPYRSLNNAIDGVVITFIEIPRPSRGRRAGTAPAG